MRASDDDPAFIARCFDEASAAASLDPAPRALTAPEHGLLAATDLGLLRRRALREVVLPCAAALLASSAPAHAQAFPFATVPTS